MPRSLVRWCLVALTALVMLGCAAPPPAPGPVDERPAAVTAAAVAPGNEPSEPNLHGPGADATSESLEAEPLDPEPIEAEPLEAEPLDLDPVEADPVDPTDPELDLPTDDRSEVGVPAPDAPGVEQAPVGDASPGSSERPDTSAQTMPSAATPRISSAPGELSAAEDVVLERGHVDLIEVTVQGTRLVVSVKDDTRPSGVVFRSPEQVQVRVQDRARIAVPSGPFGFLGPAGSQVYLLPQVQDPELVWPGWSTERLSAGQVVGDRVTMRLSSVQGPGPVALFTTDQFGSPTVLFDTAEGTARSIEVPIRTHAHASWAFRSPGVHRVTFEVSADVAGSGPTTTVATYVFLVGDSAAPLDPGAVPPPTSRPGADRPDAAAGAPGGSAPGEQVQSAEAAANAAGTTTGGRSGAAATRTGASGSLASTGSDAARTAGLAGLAVLAGAALVAGTRRRRRW